MNHGSLFSGIGGFDLAAEWMGWDNKFHCEWNEFGQKILKYHWPKSESYGDITKTDFTIWRGKVDLISGGFPCQPYSVAGKRKGKEDERHLWPEMLRCIREVQPTWIVGENVAGIVSWNGGLVFEEVCVDLENEGYNVQPVILPACAVNAPHRRDRVWFIAYRQTDRLPRSEGANRWEEYKQNNGNRVRPSLNSNGEGKFTPHPKNLQRNSDGEEGKQCRARGEARSGAERTSSEGDVADTTSTRRREDLWEGEPRFFDEKSKRNNWQDFPTQSPIRGRDDGLSERLDSITFPKWRNESIKAYGNAIVPQVAYEIFKVINQMQNEIV